MAVKLWFFNARSAASQWRAKIQEIWVGISEFTLGSNHTFVNIVRRHFLAKIIWKIMYWNFMQQSNKNRTFSWNCRILLLCFWIQTNISVRFVIWLWKPNTSEIWKGIFWYILGKNLISAQCAMPVLVGKIHSPGMWRSNTLQFCTIRLKKKFVSK